MSMAWIAVVLGIVEGLTEFLPISSTGHLIATSSFLGFHGKRAEVFQVFIQLGAILAVVWEYRVRLFGAVRDLPRRAEARSFATQVAIAFVPAAAIGYLTHDWISDRLFRVTTVAAALIAGAVLILAVEAIPRRPRTVRAEAVGPAQALAIGLAQCLALWPGFSRSAATILGGLGVGLDRRAATEFSFFLAVPTMFAATFYDLLKNRSHLEPGDLGWLAVSFAISFVVAWASIRWLIRFVSTHTFRGFAWYRIALGVILLLLADRLHLP